MHFEDNLEEDENGTKDFWTCMAKMMEDYEELNPRPQHPASVVRSKPKTHYNQKQSTEEF